MRLGRVLTLKQRGQVRLGTTVGGANSSVLTASAKILAYQNKTQVIKRNQVPTLFSRHGRRYEVVGLNERTKREKEGCLGLP